MQPIALHRHSTSSSSGVNSIFVTVQRLSTDRLQLEYQVAGDMGTLRIPTLQPTQRCDELWRHTCAELFLADPNQEAYCEFNFSPSTQWAAYEFDNYRQGMRPVLCSAPSISLAQTEQSLSLAIMVQLPVSLAQCPVLQASITMVIEHSSGAHSYWAVDNATAKPDFHCRQSFVLTI